MPTSTIIHIRRQLFHRQSITKQDNFEIMLVDIYLSVKWLFGKYYVWRNDWRCDVMIAREMCDRLCRRWWRDRQIDLTVPKIFHYFPRLRYFETLKCIEGNDKKLGECYDINKCRR